MRPPCRTFLIIAESRKDVTNHVLPLRVSTWKTHSLLLIIFHWPKKITKAWSDVIEKYHSFPKAASILWTITESTIFCPSGWNYLNKSHFLGKIYPSSLQEDNAKGPCDYQAQSLGSYYILYLRPNMAPLFSQSYVWKRRVIQPLYIHCVMEELCKDYRNNPLEKSSLRDT